MRIRLKFRRGNNRKFCAMCLQLFFTRAHKQRAGKKIVPRVFIDHPDRQPVLGIRACVQVLHKQFFATQVRHNPVKQRVKFFLDQ